MEYNIRLSGPEAKQVKKAFKVFCAQNGLTQLEGIKRLLDITKQNQL